jgi:hypothetical protein
MVFQAFQLHRHGLQIMELVNFTVIEPKQESEIFAVAATSTALAVQVQASWR